MYIFNGIRSPGKKMSKGKENIKVNVKCSSPQMSCFDKYLLGCHLLQNHDFTEWKKNWSIKYNLFIIVVFTFLSELCFCHSGTLIFALWKLFFVKTWQLLWNTHLQWREELGSFIASLYLPSGLENERFHKESTSVELPECWGLQVGLQCGHMGLVMRTSSTSSIISKNMF